MRNKRKRWKRAVSLALSSLMVLTILPANMPAARAAEEKLVNIAGEEATVSIAGEENSYDPIKYVKDGDRETTAGAFNGAVSKFENSEYKREALYDAPYM